MTRMAYNYVTKDSENILVLVSSRRNALEHINRQRWIIKKEERKEIRQTFIGRVVAAYSAVVDNRVYRVSSSLELIEYSRLRPIHLLDVCK